MSFASENAMTKIANCLVGLLLRLMGNVPVNATSSIGKNSTEIDSTTYRTIVAAPSAGKALWVKKLTIHNRTPAEDAVIIVDDGTTEIYRGNCSTAAGNGGAREVIFDPPVQLATATALQGKSAAALGDTTIIAQVFTGVVPA